jgi:hypothetical protein
MAKLKAAAGTQKSVLQEAKWFDEEILAVGQLRQGKAPSTLGMVTGTALIGLLAPKKSKLLPRHFVLVVTRGNVVALKASGGGPEDSSEYYITMKSGEEGSWPRESVTLTELEDGDQSKEGTLEIQGDSGTERFPVSRPNLGGDTDTDELLRLLAG